MTERVGACRKVRAFGDCPAVRPLVDETRLAVRAARVDVLFHPGEHARLAGSRAAWRRRLGHTDSTDNRPPGAERGRAPRPAAAEIAMEAAIESAARACRAGQ